MSDGHTPGIVLLAVTLQPGCRGPDQPARAVKSTAPPAQSLLQAEPEHQAIEVTVKKVIDGDTIRVTGVGRGTELVRLIGIDAPETGEGRTVRECFGREAERWLADQVPRGSRLRLVFDMEQRDSYGRLLAYAYRADGTFLNAALVADGHAQTMTIPPNVRHAQGLSDLQRRARSENRGLWTACR